MSPLPEESRRLRRLCFRVYRVNSAALSIGHVLLKPPVVNVDPLRPPYEAEALCRIAYNARRHIRKHSPVKPGCHCGIHGLPDLRQAYEFMNDNLAPTHNGKVVVASAHWGRLIQGDFSLRSQYVRVIGVFEPIVETRLRAPMNPFMSTHWSQSKVATLRSALEGVLPVLDVLAPWDDPAWVRAWAKERNLEPQADIVSESKLFDQLEAM